MVEKVGSSLNIGSASSVEIEKRRLKESCEEFESFLSGNLLKAMRESTMRAEEPENDREIYESMLDQTVATEMSHSKSMGVGEMLYQQLAPAIKADYGKA